MRTVIFIIVLLAVGCSIGMLATGLMVAYSDKKTFDRGYDVGYEKGFEVGYYKGRTEERSSIIDKINTQYLTKENTDEKDN